MANETMTGTMRIQIGSLLNDRYRLEAELGHGRMGVIYRAHDTLLNRAVAIKVLSTSALSADSRAYLLHEAQAAAKLNHPNIVSVHDIGEAEKAGGAPFIVMEVVEGESLHSRRPHSLDEIISMASQVCEALEHAHANAIVHRDLKPENVLIGLGGSVKLTDFGLAHTTASPLTTEEAIVGTVFYLSPEQALGQEVDGRTDLYALGVMLYELTAGRLPFTGDDPLTVISQHVHTSVIPPSAHNPAIPPALDALIVQLLSKRPQDRPASATEVKRALESLVPAQLASPSTDTPRHQEAPRGTPLLTTKLYIPSIRSELVPRPHLIHRLEDGLRLGRKFTLVSAPAGFGKTTLLSHWIAGRGQGDRTPVRTASPPPSSSSPCFPLSFAWLSLDSGDNDSARFWSYVIAALQTVRPDMGRAALAALHSPQSPPVEAVLTNLINEIAEAPDSLALVLDDYHVIAAPPITDALLFLLDNMPPQMHLIISSRTDPPWPLARLRARGQMTELRAADLRFTSEETAQFLNHSMQLPLSPEDVVALDKRTEGWIAGLQMAALSMKGRGDASTFIESFTGSHRFVLDYLAEEVFEQQPPAIQEFLLKTSVLEQMTASLCDAVIGDQQMGELENQQTIEPQAGELLDPQVRRLADRSSQGILEHLERANLFVVSLDDNRQWYRYHHLFADLLRSRLAQTHPDLMPALQRRASVWYEESGLIAEAVRFASAAGDVERTASLIEENGLAMVYHGELTTLVGWLRALPDDVVRSRPWLCIAHAWALGYAGHLDQVEPRLQDAERALPEVLDSEDDPERRHTEGHIAAIRAFVKLTSDIESNGDELARAALDRLPEQDIMARGLTTAYLAIALRIRGDLVAAAQAFDEAIAIIQATGDIHLTVDVLWERAVLESVQNHLHKVMDTCRTALQLAEEYTGRSGQRLPIAGYIYERMGTVLCEWNDLETALRYARESHDLCQQWGQADAIVESRFSLARVLLAAGDTEGALEMVQQTRPDASDLGRWYVLTAGAIEAEARLMQGDIAAASNWAQESGLCYDDEPSFPYCSTYLALARVLIAQERLNEAQSLLARRLVMVEEIEATRLVIQILTLQAIALKAMGETEQALSALERALILAEPEDCVRIFIGKGAPMAELLSQAASQGIAPDYANKLLTAYQLQISSRRVSGEGAPQTDLKPETLKPETLLEPLSKRELQVLRLLNTHLSSTEIAEELVISPNTVRSHIKNIYGKLNVHARTEAIQRAEELGLI